MDVDVSSHVAAAAAHAAGAVADAAAAGAVADAAAVKTAVAAAAGAVADAAAAVAAYVPGCIDMAEVNARAIAARRAADEPEVLADMDPMVTDANNYAVTARLRFGRSKAGALCLAKADAYAAATRAAAAARGVAAAAGVNDNSNEYDQYENVKAADIVIDAVNAVTLAADSARRASHCGMNAAIVGMNVSL